MQLQFSGNAIVIIIESIVLHCQTVKLTHCEIGTRLKYTKYKIMSKNMNLKTEITIYISTIKLILSLNHQQKFNPTGYLETVF